MCFPFCCKPGPYSRLVAIKSVEQTPIIKRWKVKVWNNSTTYFIDDKFYQLCKHELRANSNAIIVFKKCSNKIIQVNNICSLKEI